VSTSVAEPDDLPIHVDRNDRMRVHRGTPFEVAVESRFGEGPAVRRVEEDRLVVLAIFLVEERARVGRVVQRDIGEPTYRGAN
jgi:hypothetical protein